VRVAQLEDVCIKIAEKLDDTLLAGLSLDKPSALFFSSGIGTASSPLPAGLTPEKVKAMRDKVANNSAKLDAVHEGFGFFWPTLRTTRQKYRETGVLLPYGTSRVEYDT
jgi:hypothetical protein